MLTDDIDNSSGYRNPDMFPIKVLLKKNYLKYYYGVIVIAVHNVWIR